MSLPATQYIRRRELFDWLTGQGFSAGDVRKWIADEVIPKRSFPTSKHAKKKNRPRAYYHVPDVAQALQITNPLKT